MLPEPSITDKIRDEYIYSNPENFQSPNLAALCRKFDADYSSVYNIYSEENWFDQRIEFQTEHRKKKAELVEHSLLMQGINIGSEVSQIIQRGITSTSKYEKLIDDKLFKILENPDIELTVKELVDLKKLTNSRWDSVIKILMDITKLISENQKAGGESSDLEALRRMVAALRDVNLDVVVSHTVDREVNLKPKSSYDFTEESERQELFGMLDSQENEVELEDE